MTALYAKVDPEGRVVQESASFDERTQDWDLKSGGYVPVLAVRAEGVAEIRKWLKNRRGKSGSGLLRDVLDALGLPEQEEP